MTDTAAPARTIAADAAEHPARTAAGTWKLTGIDSTTGQCDCCSRRITQRAFQVTHPDYGTALLGRRCAATATGYAASAVEREQARMVRLAEVDRRREVIAAERPIFAGLFAEMRAWQALSNEQRRSAPRRERDASYYHLSDLFGTAATEDSWWDGRSRTAYATWTDYVDAHLAS